MMSGCWKVSWLTVLCWCWNASSRLGGVNGFSISSIFEGIRGPPQMKQKEVYSPNNIPEEVGDYPYCFEGRLWFRPALVKVSDDVDNIASSVKPLSLFGWSVGGVVALEYDESPVGPYKEYVTMGSLVRSSNNNGLQVGQWGSALYVSTKQAETVCQDLWKVPAQHANIQFTTISSNTLTVTQPPTQSSSSSLPDIQVDGWTQTQLQSEQQQQRGGPIKVPVFWTPSIKALWAPFFFADNHNNSNRGLPLHKLRLSAGAVRVIWCPQQQDQSSLGITIPLGLAVDNVLIEISPQKGTL